MNLSKARSNLIMTHGHYALRVRRENQILNWGQMKKPLYQHRYSAYQYCDQHFRAMHVAGHNYTHHPLFQSKMCNHQLHSGFPINKNILNCFSSFQPVHKRSIIRACLHNKLQSQDCNITIYIYVKLETKKH